MILKIGATEITITSYARKRDVQRGFYLDLVIPKESIGMDALYSLLDGNTEPIVITEEDGTENTYTGFKQIGSFACENGSYKVAQICTSEYEAQLSIAQNKIAELRATVADQNAIIGAQTTTIVSLELQNEELNETVNALLGMEE